MVLLCVFEVVRSRLEESYLIRLQVFLVNMGRLVLPVLLVAVILVGLPC